MNETKKEIFKIYTLLYGMYTAIKENAKYLEENDIEQYNVLINKLNEITKDKYIEMYLIESSDCERYESGRKYCESCIFLIKALPILEYINKVYIDTAQETVQKVGALYNAIEDSELQKRCGDILLEASDAFDRVINQATQILEDRIKKKAGLQDTTLFGLTLVSKAIHSKLENTILKFSDNPDIQEHYSSLFKGIAGVYRNSTHHGLEYQCSREDALKFCAYIDLLLKDVDNSEKVV